MAAPYQWFGQVPNMLGYTAGVEIVVRRHEGDLHLGLRLAGRSNAIKDHPADPLPCQLSSTGVAGLIPIRVEAQSIARDICRYGTPAAPSRVGLFPSGLRVARRSSSASAPARPRRPIDRPRAG